jgi:hypothetical protein
MNAPLTAVLRAIADSNSARVRSRPFPDDPRRVAYIVTGPSAASVQAAVTGIMNAVSNGQADFVGPFLKERHGHLQVWESKGVVQRAGSDNA